MSRSCAHKYTTSFDDSICCLSCGTVRTVTTAKTSVPGSDPQVYRYKSLHHQTHEIRLIELLPGQGLDPIRCCITIVELDHAPSYIALSYTWATEDGDDTATKTIYTEEKETRDQTDSRSRFLKVTTNCEAALRQVRNAYKEQTLWIDSLSIDQSNIQERNHQVSIMAEIYQRASSVHICIHDPSRQYQCALELFRNPRLLIEESRSATPVSFRQNSYILQLVELFSRRYFNRAWVIQEILVSQIAYLHVNQDVVSFYHQSLKDINDVFSDYPSIIPRLAQWASLWDFKMLSCLNMSTNSASSDPRDKIFAIASLFPARVRKLIPIDYLSSVTDVLSNAVIACIAECGDLDVLYYAGLIAGADTLEASTFGEDHFKEFLSSESRSPPFEKESIGPTMAFRRPDLLPPQRKVSGKQQNPTPNASCTTSGADCNRWMEYVRLRQQDDEIAENNDSKSSSLGQTSEDIRSVVERCPGPVPSSQILPRLKVRAHFVSTCIEPPENIVGRFVKDINASITNGSASKAFAATSLPPKPTCHTMEREWEISNSLWAKISHWTKLNPGKMQNAFCTSGGVGGTKNQHLPGDTIFAVDGARHLLLLRGVGGNSYRIVGKCFLWMWAKECTDGDPVEVAERPWKVEPYKVKTQDVRYIEVY